MITDKQYVEAIKKNNELMFTRLYESHRGVFFGYIRKYYNKDDEYIADIYQDTATALWQNIQKGKLTPTNLTCSLQTYLIGIGKYILMARDRKYKEILADQEMTTYINEFDEEKLENEIERDNIIQHTVENMGEPCNTLLDKYYWDELSIKDIAIQMDYKNADTAKTQKYKCMQKLKLILSEKIKNHNLL